MKKENKILLGLYLAAAVFVLIAWIGYQLSKPPELHYHIKQVPNWKTEAVLTISPTPYTSIICVETEVKERKCSG